MSYRLCQSQLMELPVEQPCYGEFRLCGKEKKKNALYKYSKNENIPYNFFINQKH